MCGLFQPICQVRFTNVATVRLKVHGERFEIACYKNKVVNWRSGVETDIQEVLQSPYIFTSISKGKLANNIQLMKAFNTTDINIITKQILDKGEFQISKEERNQILESTFRDIVSILHEVTINPNTGHPLTRSLLENALKSSGFSVSLNEPPKKQALKALSLLQKHYPESIARCKMRLRVNFLSHQYQDLVGFFQGKDITIEQNSVEHFYNASNSSSNASSSLCTPNKSNKIQQMKRSYKHLDKVNEIYKENENELMDQDKEDEGHKEFEIYKDDKNNKEEKEKEEDNENEVKERDKEKDKLKDREKEDNKLSKENTTEYKEDKENYKENKDNKNKNKENKYQKKQSQGKDTNNEDEFDEYNEKMEYMLFVCPPKLFREIENFVLNSLDPSGTLQLITLNIKDNPSMISTPSRSPYNFDNNYNTTNTSTNININTNTYNTTTYAGVEDFDGEQLLLNKVDSMRVRQLDSELTEVPSDRSKELNRELKIQKVNDDFNESVVSESGLKFSTFSNSNSNTSFSFSPSTNFTSTSNYNTNYNKDTDTNELKLEPRFPERVTNRVTDSIKTENNKKRCLNCNIEFDDNLIYRKHFKSDFHVFNSKRKLQGLDPISQDEYQHIQSNLS